MRDVVIALDAEEDARDPDERDTLRQAAEIARALGARGRRVSRLEVTREASWIPALERLAPETVVYVLVEGVRGRHFLPAFFCHLVEERGLAHTGARAESLYLHSSKWSLKAHLLALGLPSPAGIDAAGNLLARAAPGPKTPFLLKSVWEHSSIGIEAELVPFARVGAALAAKEEPGAWFAEEYVHGREFSVALLEEGPALEVLAISEILFLGSRAGMPWVLDYEAKWDEASRAHRETPSVFPDFAGAEAPLRARIEAEALRAAAALGLKGPVRLDFRLHADGTLYLIDVNLNPCLAPEAGFARAGEKAGIAYEALIERLVANAERSLEPNVLR
ncbi:MAG: hypothetical protein H6923_02115 [Alphaproteobacteria bacterium]|nr:hypothetical protein [Alphaproteobacteria bacterium]